MWIAWHLKGAPDFDKWLAMPNRLRLLIRREVVSRIETHNDAFSDD